MVCEGDGDERNASEETVGQRNRLQIDGMSVGSCLVVSLLRAGSCLQAGHQANFRSSRTLAWEEGVSAVRVCVCIRPIAAEILAKTPCVKHVQPLLTPAYAIALLIPGRASSRTFPVETKQTERIIAEGICRCSEGKSFSRPGRQQHDSALLARFCSSTYSRASG